MRQVRDLDDYLYRGPAFADLSPYTYKAVVSRVRKSEVSKRSKKKIKGGKRPHQIYPFCRDHHLSDTHVQRLRGKFSNIQLIGMQKQKNPGPAPDSRNALPAWEKNMTKLCNFIEAVYLPWQSHRPGFRPYQEVLAELASFKTCLLYTSPSPRD